MKTKNNRLLLKIFSGIIAIVLWFAITYTEDPIINQNISGIKLSIEGEDELNKKGLMIADKKNIPDISVTIRGNRSKVISSLGSVKAVADVSDITEAGEAYVDISYSYQTTEITMIKAKTTQVKLNAERIVTKEIPVKIKKIEKELGPLVKHTIITKTVEISGAANTVNRIAYAVADVDINTITENETRDYGYTLVDENGILISEENITKKGRETVIVENVVYDNKKELPVKFVLSDEMRAEYGFVVKEASKKQVIAGFDGDTSAEYLEATITVAGDDTKAYLTVPDGVYVSPDDCIIEVSGELVPKTLQEVTAEIEVKNVPNGKKAVVEPKEKKITVKTAEKNVVLTATADAGNISGGGIVPLEISSEQDVDIIGNYSVFVGLEAEE